MRTDTTLGGREVLAVWMTGLVQYYQCDYCNKLSRVLTETKMGKNLVKRDLLHPGSNEKFITKNYNNARRSCTVIWLDTLQADVVNKLKRGQQVEIVQDGFFSLICNVEQYVGGFLVSVCMYIALKKLVPQFF